MKITLDIRKSIDENAASYFESAKKDKKKIEGTKKVIFTHEEKLKEELVVTKKEFAQKKIHRKTEWYERFRWFYTSSGFLVIGGRDSTTNEIVVKKHCDKDDVVLHTDMAGSPFVVIKCADKKPSEEDLQEAGDFTAVFSRGWKNGMATLPVFYVKPEQVSKIPNAGESLPKGAFVIRGQTNYLSPTMNYAIGLYEDRIMGGPISSVKKYCSKYIEIVQGDGKVSDVAKTIKKLIGGELDEIIRVLPQSCKIKKN